MEFTGLIPKFEVESWMDKYENICRYNLAETCCDSVSLNQLEKLSDNKSSRLIIDYSRRLDYGSIRGLESLRNRLANLYSAKSGKIPLTKENILTCAGAISANFIVLYSLIKPGSHVICHYPTYQALYTVPESLGAKVDLWKADASNQWIPKFEDLKRLVQPCTKLIILNNPNNPTGALLPKSLLREIVKLAEEKNIIILSDEVYRPIFHSVGPQEEEFPSSIISMGYNNVIATGSLSKAYSLAGIRVGWIASKNLSIIEQCAEARHYTTLSVGQFDELVADFALGEDVIHNLLLRNIKLARNNLERLTQFIDEFKKCINWVKPIAGTTAFIQFHNNGKPVDSKKLCENILGETGVLFVPGKESFGDEWEGYVRIGYCCNEETLENGLNELRKYFKENDIMDSELAK